METGRSTVGWLLGVDTGGTFTDAVLYDEDTQTVVAKAKSPTTHDDLAIGISGAIDAVLAAGAVDPADIELVSLSTTLATNALVEGRGRSVALVVIGFEPEVLERAGLAEALGDDPVVFLDGGHDAHGNELRPFDAARLAEWLHNLPAGVAGVAVASEFSVRNPAHEQAARALVRQQTGLPVSCSYQLSAQLNGPKRAVTAVLNARLIPIIHQLVDTMRATLLHRGIHAPLMVVRGDGSLVSADFVAERPIETILSGPAASLVGAAHLTGLAEAVISDIGGTTTDIAVLHNGRPVLSAEGATVGGYRTMVSAVEMHTLGLGGDSEIRRDQRRPGAALSVGPRRVIPLSLLAVEHPELVHRMLDRQLLDISPSEVAGVVIVPTVLAAHRVVDGRLDAELLAALTNGPVPAVDLRPSVVVHAVLDRLSRHGLIRLSAFTPTDASHTLGLHDHFDTAAAHKAAQLFARHRDSRGAPIAADGPTVARIVVDAVIRRSAEAVLSAAFVADGLDPDLATSALVRRDLDRSLHAVQAGIGLSSPLVGLGASAATYYPAVAALLRTESVVPEHADVANAVGAVVGRITITRQITVTSPAQGQFVAYLDTPRLHTSAEAARDAAETTTRASLAAEMQSAGAGDYETTVDWQETTVDFNGLTLFISGTLTVMSSGRPRLGSNAELVR